MEAHEIPVIRETRTETFEQTIRPRNQEEVPDLLLSLCRMMRQTKFTGTIHGVVNEGGVQFITTAQTARGSAKLQARNIPLNKTPA